MSLVHEIKYTSEANRLIKKAEQLFGNMVSTYVFHGVKFEGTRPQIYFTPPPDGISIYLTPSVLNFEMQAYFQLAHETLHLLGPIGKPVASNIEEGLACLYSIIIMQEMFSTKGAIYANQGIFNSSYKQPYLKVLSIFNTDKYFFKKLRIINPFLSNLNISDFGKISHKFDKETVDYLIRPMYY